MALIHAFLTITMRADQVVSGLALTLFGTGLSSFLGQRLGPDGSPLVGLIGPRFRPISIPVLSEIPIIGQMFFNQDILVYIIYLLCAFELVLPLQDPSRVCICAPLEKAHKRLTRWESTFSNCATLYTMIGGMLVGLGGAHLSLAYTPGWAEHLTGGRGWIAIALVIFATWDPGRAVIGALLFRRCQRHSVSPAGDGYHDSSEFVEYVAIHFDCGRAGSDHVV
jgi:general nucleoside transport system permease protein